ncbi:F-box protein family [Quillaja saponaria]|uniref:F-box protein family n=1 Tax=Quillaja saponaria TaxID=32244 RepID=A0AAD7LXL4_QUISA|nr:F-box protein family [Quillaja saponaria]
MKWSVTTSNSRTINDLLDDVLSEILTRVPCKSVVRSKSVSKRWSALISSLEFHLLYIRRAHRSFQKLLNHDCYFNFNSGNALIIPKLLALEEEFGPVDRLFSTPKTDTVCISIERRFRVVLIHKFLNTEVEFNVDVFSSETGNWNRLVVSCPRGFACATVCRPAGVAYKGKLHFLGAGGILVFDPYHHNNQCDYPIDSSNVRVSNGPLGISCGSLLISQFVIEPPRYSPRVKVWELQDYNENENEKVLGTWHLLHNTYLRSSRRKNYTNSRFEQRQIFLRLLVFHPYNQDIVYWKQDSCIFSCNLRTDKELEEVEKVGDDIYSQVWDHVIPVVLPAWWATPIIPRSNRTPPNIHGM